MITEAVVYKISERIGRIADALDKRNAIEVRKVEALELHNRVHLLEGWAAYRVAGGANTLEDMAARVVELENLLMP